MPNAFTEVGLRLDIQVVFWIAVALVALTVICWIADAIWFDMWFGTFSAGTFAVLAVLVWVCTLIPFDAKYHHIYRITGTVTEVSNVLESGSGELTYAPVVSLAEHDFPLIVNSSRAAGLAGEEVTFTCGVGWVYQSADYYDCSIAEVHR